MNFRGNSSTPDSTTTTTWDEATGPTRIEELEASLEQLQQKFDKQKAFKASVVKVANNNLTRSKKLDATVIQLQQKLLEQKASTRSAGTAVIAERVKNEHMQARLDIKARELEQQSLSIQMYMLEVGKDMPSRND
jgi:wyosine [tRNA(Phe)-imidazoG37] synthetase (radical SAM superfamily)